MIDVYREFIGALALGCGYRKILELGCETFGATNIIRRWNPEASITCVDNCRRVNPPKWVRFINKSTDEFFEANTERYDLVFVDADHSWVQAHKDVEAAFGCLLSGGTVVIHDTDPISKKFEAPTHCGDSWKMLAKLEERYRTVTLPMENTGLTIVRDCADTRVDRWM